MYISRMRDASSTGMVGSEFLIFPLFLLTIRKAALGDMGKDTSIPIQQVKFMSKRHASSQCSLTLSLNIEVSNGYFTAPGANGVQHACLVKENKQHPGLHSCLSKPSCPSFLESRGISKREKTPASPSLHLTLPITLASPRIAELSVAMGTPLNNFS